MVIYFIIRGDLSNATPGHGQVICDVEIATSASSMLPWPQPMRRSKPGRDAAAERSAILRRAAALRERNQELAELETSIRVKPFRKRA